MRERYPHNTRQQRRYYYFIPGLGMAYAWDIWADNEQEARATLRRTFFADRPRLPKGTEVWLA